MKRQVFLLIFFLLIVAGRAAGQCTPTSGSTPVSACKNSLITPIVFHIAGGSNVHVTPALPAGIDANWDGASGDLTISGTPSVTSPTTSYTITYDPSGTCTDAFTISVNAPTANAGSDVEICEGGTTLALGGSIGGSATGGTWTTSDGGTFTNETDAVNATWTPGAGFTGTATLTLTTTGGSCGTTSDTKVVTVKAAPAADAGLDISICKDLTTPALAGSVGGSATGGTWSTTDGGSFTNASDPANATWTPGAGFTGVATLTLTTTDGGCGTTTDTKTVTVNAPTADAGLDMSICKDATTPSLAGSVGGTATGGTWSATDGAFTNENDPLNATWTPAAGFTGPATLTLTTSGGVCGTITDTKIVTVNAPTANAGPDVEICEGATTSGLGGTVGGSATGGTWSTIDGGTFTNETDPLNATWTPGAGFTGTATLTLTTTGGSCGTTTDTKIVTVKAAPAADAGLDISICKDVTTPALAGSVGGSATGGTWSTTDGGSFTNASDPANATWTPGAGFTGVATLTLTTTDGGCGTTTDTKTVTVNAPTADAGLDMSICKDATTPSLAGSVGGTATGGTWSATNGAFTNENDPLNATWTPAAGFTGAATLTLTTSGGVCGTITDTKIVTVNAPTANAGPDVEICEGATTLALGGSIGGIATGGSWSTTDGGSFTNAGNPATATWTPNAGFSGPATLTLTTSGGSCGTTTDTKIVTVNAKPIPTGVTVHLDAGELLRQYVTVDVTYTYTSATCPAEVLSGTRISWYRADDASGTNSSFITTKTGNDRTYTLTGDDVNKFIQVIVEAWDGTTLSVPVSSSWEGQVLPNAVPVASALNITGTPSVGNELTANFTYNDAESDAQGTHLYKWYADGAVINKATSSTYTVVKADRGKIITFSVQPVAVTGSSPGVLVTSPATPLVGDQAPVATNVSFTPNTGLKVGQALTGTYTYSDNEGDPEGTSIYQWYSGDVSGTRTAIGSATARSFILTNAQFTSSTNYIYFSVKPVAAAGTAEGTIVYSGKYGPVSNPAPTASFPVPAITGILNVNELLTGHYIYSDGEGDLEGATSVAWESSPDGSGSWIAAGTTISHLITESEQGRYFRIRVTPRAATGTPAGTEITSATYGPVNTKPHIDGIGITGTPAVGTALTGTYTYHDINGDAFDHFDFSWLRDGTTIPGQTANSYTLTYDDEGHMITFKVVPYAQTGYLAGEPSSASTAAVTDANAELPVANNICIEGTRVVGQVLTGKYTYVHHRPELNSEYKWYRNDVAIDGAIYREYTVQEADTDAKITFKVRPRTSNVPPRGDTWFESQEFPRITGLNEQYGPNDSDVTLSVTPLLDPLEGYYTGKGVTGTTFSPQNATVGRWEINYFRTYINGTNTCSQRTPQSVKVSAEFHSILMNSQYCSYDPVFTAKIDPPDFVPYTSSVQCYDAENISDMAGIYYNPAVPFDIVINPALLRDGSHTLYYYYTINMGIFLPIKFRLRKDFTIVKVSKEAQFIGLKLKYCKDSDPQVITVKGVNSLVGTGTWQFEGDPSDGALLTETATASVKFVPKNAVAGRKYIKYKYSYKGCESNQLRDPVDIYNSPDARFNIDDYYNIDGPEVSLTPLNPANTGGVFAGEGVSGNLLIPSLASEVTADITYTYTDANFCIGTWTETTTFRKAKGSITGITPIVCYDNIDLTLNASDVPVNGTDGVVSYKGFSNQRGTLTPVPNTTSVVYSLPAIVEGEDVITFSYVWDGVEFSISKKVLIDNLGTVQIYNLAQNQNICDDVIPFKLTVSKPGGLFTGLVNGENFDPKAGPFNYVTYTYTNPKTTCQIYTTVNVNVHKAPAVDFMPHDVCIDDDTDTLMFYNNTTSFDPVVKWKWEFEDEGTITPDYRKEAGYLYLKGGLQKIALNAETSNGCVVRKEKTINIGRRPDADFFWKKDCYHPGESLQLFDATSYSTPVIDMIWKKDGAAFGTGSKVTLPKTGTGYITLEHIVTTAYANCYDIVTKDVYIRPAIMITSDGYFEDFESGGGGWVKSDTSSIWSFGAPSGSVLNSAASGSTAWFTSAPRNDTASVESPCYDFTNLTRPLFKLKIQKALDKERDGVALQYRIGDEWKWHTVGTLNDGINWYNSATISGEPGGSQVGWTTPGLFDTQIQTASHTLDELTGKKDVVFRMTYGSDGSNVKHDGFMFDDVFIGDRTRHVLVEHFMNITDAKSSEVKSLVDTIAEHKKADVINIQYHTNFPGNDRYYSGNPGEINARVLYYGLTRVPYTFVDGGNDPKMHAMVFDHINTEIDSNAITKRSLVGSPFIIVLDPEINGRLLTVNGSIKAVERLESANLNLFIVVTEKTNSEGGTSFLNIFRKFIPDAGGIILKNNWLPGDEETISRTWTIDRSLDASSIEIIAFLQNRITQQVYQSSSVIKPKISVGIGDALMHDSEYTIYPNPASDRITVEFGSQLSRDAVIRIYGIGGEILREYKAGAGTSEFTIEDCSLRGGVYMLRVIQGKTDFGYRKLIITEN